MRNSPDKEPKAVSQSLERASLRPMSPLHAILIASTIPLFLGAVLSSWAYARTFEIQWTNFASWLVAGGLVFAGLALVWSLIELFAPSSGIVEWLRRWRDRLAPAPARSTLCGCDR